MESEHVTGCNVVTSQLPAEIYQQKCNKYYFIVITKGITFDQMQQKFMQDTVVRCNVSITNLYTLSLHRFTKVCTISSNMLTNSLMQ